MKNKITTWILVLALLAGLSLLLYPTVSDYWNSLHASQAVATYAEDVKSIDKTQYDELLAAAHSYNESLHTRTNDFYLTDEQQAAYDTLLNIGQTGIMGYIEIPVIKLSLPIYHGTSDSVLQIAVGHLDWTSLPVGGTGTHCVLSGHRGLPSAKLFTNLDQMKTGDTFVIRVLDEVLTYEVNQILIVEPNDTSALTVEAGKDLCTLVTCTPYGINSHRLLVRGHRVENTPEAKMIRVVADALQIEPLIVAPVVAAPVLLILFVMLMLPKRKKHIEKEKGDRS
ncbi:MAG: class C sortase [Eubacteriales bacterium]|nr:class C sortase [Eubacteriales bacterium]MDY5346033.1 class C sortase [Eubacteriales bacterium]